MTALALRTAVPVEPDGPTARRWAEAELSDPVYHRRESLLDRLWQWVLEQLAQAGTVAVDPRMAALVLAGVLVLGLGTALIVAGPVRRARRAERQSRDVFGDDTRTAAELRASADAHAAAGRWGPAVLDRVRAVLRSLEERALLDDRPGRTAHEATQEAGARLPAVAADLHRAGLLFDDVRYGDAVAGPGDDAWLREVDRRVATQRPPAPDAVRRAAAGVPG